MIGFVGGRRRLLSGIAALGFFIIIINLLGKSGPTVARVPFLGSEKTKASDELSEAGLSSQYEPVDAHPITTLMAAADKRWRDYESNRSKSFRQTVSKYRRKYGRHPPPKFDIWYQYAKERNVWNIDDFEQVMDDLRPFWAIEPKEIRALAAHMWEVQEDGISGLHLRSHEIVRQNNPGWRSDTMASLIKKFAEHLPDMDIAMNRMDQPRVVVSWDNMQAHLTKEIQTRQMLPEAIGEFTTNMTGFLDLDMAPEDDKSQRVDAGWYGAVGIQYMTLAKTACPPESHANNEAAVVETELLYKSRVGGVVTSFNLSTDLCTVGPEIQEKHGFLFSATSMRPTKRLVPVFGECKVNVNSDILFPANMYWLHDDRYDYDPSYDVPWEEKQDKVIWRGVTSGGMGVPETYLQLHRQRLVMMLNGTEMEKKEVRVLTEQPEAKGEYENFRQFDPGQFLKDHSDVGFTEATACIPNCSFLYDNVLEYKAEVPLAKQFQSKYLVDVDGHSFSGRWRAFLESRGLGIKATIFREWHDSRLFEWRHFIPLDNRYDDIYTILTYFIGYGKPKEKGYVERHDVEAKRIALQGREWANKVLRRDDMEVYMFRLMLEYARIIDDNRDHIGYSGDGAELDKFDEHRDT